VTTKIEAHYLVIGAGAVGKAFTDTLVTETNAAIAIVDRLPPAWPVLDNCLPIRALPFYGVNSRHLEATRSIARAGTRTSTNSRPVANGLRPENARELR
jgi:hypothetical protein